MVFCGPAEPRAPRAAPPQPQSRPPMHRTRPRLAPLTAALATALVLFSGAAQAQSLVLSNLVVDNQAGSLMARFGVAVEGVAEVSENLNNGVTLALACKARLTRAGGLVGGPKISEAELTSRLKFDALAREYTLSLPGREAPLRNARLDDLLRAGWSELALDLGSWRMLERGQDYTVVLDIRLTQAEIPGWFKRNLFFWSWDVIPASTYQLHFKY